MSIMRMLLALVISTSVGGCSRSLFAGALNGPMPTSPARILVEQALRGAGFRDLSGLTTASWNPSPHGLNASFYATGYRGDVQYRVSGVYDVLAGIIIQSMTPVGHR